MLLRHSLILCYNIALMRRVEQGSNLEKADAIILSSEKRFRRLMQEVYRNLDCQLREAPDSLPLWIYKKSRYRIVTDAGDPTRPAIALRPNGEFVYVKAGISRGPAQKDPELKGPTYLKIALQTLKRLEPLKDSH